MRGSRLLGVELVDVEITGDLNQRDRQRSHIGPLVEQERNRRTPDRAKMFTTDPDGFREAWSIQEQRWADTVERARRLEPTLLHESVAGSGLSSKPCGTSTSPAPQLRQHLNFASTSTSPAPQLRQRGVGRSDGGTES
jgi:hypothetical protein